MTADTFYHIRLYSNGKVEIFQNVFYHHVHVVDGVVSWIEIKYSSHRNRGNCTNSSRSMEGVYDTIIGDDPHWDNYIDAAPREREIIFHGRYQAEPIQGPLRP